MVVEVWWSSLLVADRALLALLDGVERARVEALSRPADQGRSLVGAALLRVAVGRWLGVRPADVVVDRSCAECGQPHGRPRILGPGRDLPSVSVSHSGVLVVAAVADRPVGIDVQRIGDLDTRSTRSDASAARLWTAREAVRKLGSDGLGGQPVVRPVPPPREGYAAALAMPDGSPTLHPSEVQLGDSARFAALAGLSGPLQPTRPRTLGRARQQ